jgi:antitoxin VapB
MSATAKIFSTGNSQAVRLPKAFRVNATEMWISKNTVTGEITLKPKPTQDSLNAFFALLTAFAPSAEFLQERNDSPARNCLDDWAT